MPSVEHAPGRGGVVHGDRAPVLGDEHVVGCVSGVRGACRAAALGEPRVLVERFGGGLNHDDDVTARIPLPPHETGVGRERGRMVGHT